MEIEGFIRLTNYYDHPAEPNYKVFHFRTQEMGDHFEMLLKEKGIAYERHDDNDTGKLLVLFGVKRHDFKEALRCNFLTHGKYRKPLIQNKTFRFTFLFFILLLIGIAIWRYQVSQ